MKKQKSKINKSIVNFFNEKNISYIILAIFILSIIPLLTIGKYNHPCADDFSYGSETAIVWRNTGSLTQTIKQGIESTKQFYNTWQGSFVGIFFMTLHPAIFNESFYFLGSTFILLFYCASVFIFFNVILKKYFKSSIHSVIILSCCFLFCTLQFSRSPVEALYWYNGALYYTTFFSLCLCLISLILTLYQTDKSSVKILLTILGTLTGFIIGGGNFVTALTMFVVLLCTSLFNIINKRYGINFVYTLIITTALFASLIISVIAPGNTIRQGAFEGTSPLVAVLFSFWYAIRFLFYFLRFPVYIAIIAVSPLLNSISKKSDLHFKHPLIFTFLSICIFASSFTPNLYSVAQYGPTRVTNVNQYIAILTICSLITYWCGYVNKNKSTKKTNSKKNESFILGITCVCIFTISCFIISGEDINSMATPSAVNSLKTGEAKLYHEQYLSRLEQINDPNISNPILPEFTSKPYILYFDDITENPSEWQNQALSKYYQKESVILGK